MSGNDPRNYKKSFHGHKKSSTKESFGNNGDSKIVGIMVKSNGKLQLQPCDKKKAYLRLDLKQNELKGASEGDVVLAKESRQKSGYSVASVTRVLGQKTSPGILSLISLYERGLSDVFSQAALNEAKAMPAPDLKGREDLRSIPLVTIDGPDARDFDDAVFAEKTADGGFHLIVAIADVSWYVRPGSALDKDAFERGNSTYFPDRVVPMLPEELSNGLCSLKPNEDRACMAFHLTIDNEGNLTGQKVVRGLMRSVARLTYDQVQAAKDGKPDAVTTPLMDNVISPLYEAYAALGKAREKRGAMSFELPEHKVKIDSKGGVADVDKAVRHESCKVIEEFMILANVAAAKSLEEKEATCVYRIHKCPPYMEVEEGDVDTLREYVSAFGMTLPPVGDIEKKNAAAYSEVIKEASKLPYGHLVIDAILRSQSKAVYDTDNIGHFGLALGEYAHFTSPIRRYADLLVHRSLIDAFNLGAGGLDNRQKADIQLMADHISKTEVLSAKAERSAHDRFAATFLAAHVGDEFTGRISTAIPAGLFIRLDNAGTDGFLPIKSLPKDYYDFDKEQKMLEGRDHGRIYRTGAQITVKLKEANGLTGSVILETANDNGADIPGINFSKKATAKKPSAGGPRT